MPLNVLELDYSLFVWNSMPEILNALLDKSSVDSNPWDDISHELVVIGDPIIS